MAARLRQFTFAAADLDQACALLERELGLGEPFHDPQVASLDLVNALYTVGDQFLEVITPTKPDTTVARRLARMGAPACGYLLLAQVDDIDLTRRLAGGLGIRRLFDVDLPAIRGMQLHPVDLGGSMLECHTPAPPHSWEWAGPGWQDRPATGVARVAGATLACAEPRATAVRWASLLAADPALDGGRLLLGDTWLGFRERDAGEPDHLAEVVLVGRDGQPRTLDVSFFRSLAAG